MFLFPPVLVSQNATYFLVAARNASASTTVSNHFSFNMNTFR